MLIKRTLLNALIITTLVAAPILGIAKPPQSKKAAGNPAQSVKVVHRFGKKVKQTIVAYAVKKGDTDEKIAKQIGLSVKALRHLNGGKKLGIICEGQQLNIAKFAVAPKYTPPALSRTSRSARYARAAVSAAKPVAAKPEKRAVIAKKEAPRRTWVAKAGPAIVPVEAPRRATPVAEIPTDEITVTSETTEETMPIAEASEPQGEELALALDKETKPAPKKGSVEAILKKAKSFRGVRYRWGAASRSATDCSGFTSQVFRANGYKIPRTSAEQSKVGKRVERGEIRAGDLVFFKTIRGTRVSHVGIAIGGGKFIHASSGGHKVMISGLSDSYYANHYVTARRVAKSSVVQGVVDVAKTAQETQQVPLDPEPQTGATDVIGN